MEKPVAEPVVNRLGRREVALDLAEAVEDEVVDSVGAVDLPSAEPALLLQKMENKLVRHHLAKPDVLSVEELRRLRYLLNFARLADFEPGAAGPGGNRGRGDVSVGAELASWRAKVADALHGPLREERDPATALGRARDALTALTEEQDEQRRSLIDRHGNDFSAAELDAEVGYKKLVTVLGGGGGAGFVYIGGMQRLLEAGQVPDYMIGASFGSIMGSVVARALPVPIDEYVAWAKTVTYGAILGPERLRRRHGLAGLFSLRFDEFAQALFTRADGERMRLSDLAIPFDAVLAGVRRQPYAALPSKFRRPELAALQMRSLPFRPIGIGPQVARRLWQVSAFIDVRVVKPIVVGDNDLTRDFNVVDAASFSSAIPGVLHHETSDPRMVPILDALCDDKDVSALVDGGAASNVPVELAWKRVRDGRLGTRNACYLAFDCFHPQWDPRHLWLVPIAQAVQLQMVRNAPYADHLVRFSPTLSPANLAPSARSIDRACAWGRKSVDKAIPVTTALLQPTWWEGDRPAVPGAETDAPPKSVASPMSAVMAAIHEPANRLARWRSRRLT
ncbi:putative esterase of the alpha-beta hydrolase superfamily [Mycolicibacterium rhodesiae NBB3]|uniref:Putative esterase of the alpha-beta hydrolase superfamily n=1 Tax=Mycolicibacterium rhodesiae (strain NBB3) TaxID=710685 RepID=G8RTQ8_MYCRN|nr:patatin-like phospholipase family protein [Mycolicibacterium rhodesiae]AEV76621.1 putative esterase of the alpha-beta hydrolase superfamily [Mycolicibacterium rhodesiae NBB3]